MVDWQHTESATWHRIEKAHRLADHLAGRGVTRADAAALSVKGRRATERRAGVRRCSDETWDLALDRLGDRE